MNTQEAAKFLKWALDYWYVSYDNGIVTVRKGRTRRKFKMDKYRTAEDLIDDIHRYMNDDPSRYKRARLC